MDGPEKSMRYMERDPIRGKDSFAAFEELLLLAKQRKVDFVLLGGDLFHENKPSRRTLYRTMDILRRHCMGPEPVGFQVISEQAQNFKDRFGHVNYEDPFFSVGLPLFSIHGNHDDPTREGGVEALAALDLLHVANLVNYFGKSEKVDDVEVNPILLQKGATKVALYGMGSMRDERLNRMWQQKKVKFLRPSEGAGGQDFFNIFVLHQNRDLGRGKKNCIHESMIPEWMDLVVWGHEHECQIDPLESLVGTFRVTQPGSSVATSLTEGEAVPKRVGILEVCENQFRMTSVLLSQVRSFKMGDIVLSEVEGLDSKGANVDEAVGEVLADKVEEMVKELLEKEEGMQREPPEGQEYLVEKRDQVLVRLRVEHSEFPTLNNQRFGSQFIGKVANPSDLLLFYRRRKMSGSGSATAEGSKATAGGLSLPIRPDDLDDVRVEDLVMENLENSAKKLSLLVEPKLTLALEDYVHKGEAQAVNDLVKETLETVQKALRKQKAAGNAAMIDDAVAKISEKEEAKIEAERLRNKPPKVSLKPERSENKESKPGAVDKGDGDGLSDEHDDEGIAAASDRHGQRVRDGGGAGAKAGGIRDYFGIDRTGGRGGEDDDGGVGDDFEGVDDGILARSRGRAAGVVSRRPESRGTGAATERGSGGARASAAPGSGKGRAGAISATGSRARGICKVDGGVDVDDVDVVASGERGDEIEISDDEEYGEKDVSVQRARDEAGARRNHRRGTDGDSAVGHPLPPTPTSRRASARTVGRGRVKYVDDGDDGSEVDEVGPSGERDDDESFNPAGIDDKDDEEEEDEGKVEDARFESEDDLIVGTRPAAGRRGAKGKGRSVPAPSSRSKTTTGAKPTSRRNGTSTTSTASRRGMSSMTVSRAGKRSAADSPPAEDAPEAAGDARGGARKRRLPAWASGADGARHRRDDDDEDFSSAISAWGETR